MSLINDALKRATQAQPPAVTAAPASAQDEAPMQAVEPHRSVGLPVYFMPVLLFVISGACYFLVHGWDAHRQAGLYPEPVTIHAREITTPIAGGDPVPAATAQDTDPAPIPENRQFSLNDATTTTTTPATPARIASVSTHATAASDETDKPAGLRLQGIFYRAARPSALVNAKTVFVGDIIANAKVQSISRETVTLLVDGQTQVLTLR